MKEIYHSKLLNIFGSSDYKALPKEMYETFKQVIKEDLKYYAKIHSIESFGTVDGPRYTFCIVSARLPSTVQILPQ